MTVDKILEVEKNLNDAFFERRDAVRGLILATLSRTNILFLGSAGIAKSALVNTWNKSIEGGVYFSWLLTKFSTPEEIFGPPSLKGLEEERYYRVTKNKLPEATTAFLDEVFKANSSILNSLLTVLNERTFYNDGVSHDLSQLLTVAGASNEIPEAEDGLDAFYDRFLLKFWLRPIQEASNFTKMLSSTALDEAPKTVLSVTEIREAQQELSKVDIPPSVMKHVVKLRSQLRKEGISVTDRTFKVAFRVLRAEAYLNKRTEVSTSDLEIFKHICWNKPDQEKNVHSMILELVAPEKNKILTLYNECQEVSKAVYKHKDAAKQQTALVEANKKIREAMIEISKLESGMKADGKDTAEIEKMKKDLEALIMDMTSNVIGINIASLSK